MIVWKLLPAELGLQLLLIGFHVGCWLVVEVQIQRWLMAAERGTDTTLRAHMPSNGLF